MHAHVLLRDNRCIHWVCGGGAVEGVQNSIVFPSEVSIAEMLEEESEGRSYRKHRQEVSEDRAVKFLFPQNSSRSHQHLMGLVHTNQVSSTSVVTSTTLGLTQTRGKGQAKVSSMSVTSNG